VAIGVGLAVLVAPRLETLLFEVPPLDVATFAGAIVVLIVVAWVAAFVPARRAAGADPARAFRTP
jgi:ABC-type lipoprotein release transport system permease subunit